MNPRKLLIAGSIALVLLVAVTSGAVADRLFGFRPLDRLFPPKGISTPGLDVTQKILKEESVVIDVAERLSPSVVTISRQSPARRSFEFDPFGGFGIREEEGREQDIGTGFIVSKEGHIVTNKHVVSETGITYKVITKDGKEFNAEKIYRDPANDLAIVKINPGVNNIAQVELGDSGNLKVGQFVIAIGTALGEFRHTVTTGVISGLGRGIFAGTPFEGVERLDNVIQTDAAINPGNSGGPLINSAGQVIGVNVAVAQGAQNIGFAIPINIVKDSIKNFEETGSFSRPFLGVQYQMIERDTALLNKVPQGALVRGVVSGSPAATAGIKESDILTKLDGQDVNTISGGLAALIGKKKVGDQVLIELWRNAETKTLSVTLTEMSE